MNATLDLAEKKYRSKIKKNNVEIHLTENKLISRRMCKSPITYMFKI